MILNLDCRHGLAMLPDNSVSAIVTDPFAGSGSTGKAAILEGFQFIGFELDPHYTEIANARIEHARAGLGAK